MTENAQAAVTVMWTVFGAMGTALLGLIVYGIKAQVVATFNNTLSIQKLTDRVDELLRQYERINKMEKDINEAHVKLRQAFQQPRGEL
jgi:hypothetical protein